MSEVILENIVKTYGSVRATDSIDLTIKDGEFVTLLGPSGCGKTTLLRSIAGLERPDSGRIRLGERVVTDSDQGIFVPTERRDLGMVFQSYALWPHMSVRNNIAYPLRVRRRGSKKEIEKKVLSLMKAVGLEGMHHRQISEMSGGQQQRVALARALAGGSDLVLYDEPLSNLDAGMRLTMRDEIRAIHDELGTTSVFVTHDQEEALALSDRVVLLNKGTIVQMGAPHEVYARPRNAFVANFLGFENIFDASLDAGGNERKLVLAGGKVVLTRDVYPRFHDGHDGLAIQAMHVRLGGAIRENEGTVMQGRVKRRSYGGNRTLYVVDVNGLDIHVMVLNHLAGNEALPEEGELTPIQLPPQLIAPLANAASTDAAALRIAEKTAVST